MSYRIRQHPEVAHDLDQIAAWLIENAGVEIAAEKLALIEAGMVFLSRTPHIGTLRHEVAYGLRAIPVAKNAVVVFTVHEDTREVMVYTVTWGGADWLGRARRRLR